MRNILEILVQNGVISAQRAKEIGDRPRPNFEIEEILRTQEKVSDENITRAYGSFYGLPFIRLRGRKIAGELLDYIPEELARKYQVVVFNKNGSVLEIALAAPAYLKENAAGVLTQTVRQKGWGVKLFITTKDDLAAALSNYHHPPVFEQLFPKTGIGTPTLAEAVKIIPAKPETSALPAAKEFPEVSLKEIRLSANILLRLPESIAKKYKLVVFGAPAPDLIKIAAADPQDNVIQEIIEFIEKRNKVKTEIYKASLAEINEALKKYELYRPPTPAAGKAPDEPEAQPKAEKKDFERTKEGSLIIEEGQISEIVTKGKEEEISGEEIAELMEETNLDKFLEGAVVDSDKKLAQIIVAGNLPKIVAGIISFAIISRASDIHFEPREKDLCLRYRIDGILREIMSVPLELQGPIISRIKILAKLKLDEQRIPQDGRFQVFVRAHEVDLRVSTLPTIHKEKAVLRILDKSAGLLTLAQIGLRGEAFEILKQQYLKPHGIILATGPTGSGKSTTLYGVINEINKPGVNIVTLEDPVEFEINNVNQCQVKPKIGFTFAEGLRSILRQDPNIIMVGEIRDRETADLAIHAALTGHLVLSTLHTNNAAGAMPRLINMGIEPFLITSSLNGVIAQRLVRRICEKCKEELEVPATLRDEIKREIVNLKPEKELKFYRGKGCQDCTDGYRGRLGIFEILTLSPIIEDLVIKRASSEQIHEKAIEGGMLTMKQDGILKVIDGLTTIDEVLRVTMTE